MWHRLGPDVDDTVEVEQGDVVRLGQHVAAREPGRVPASHGDERTMPRVKDPGGPPPAAERLRLRPFRPLRFDPKRVGRLADVTSPPYDVIGPDGVARYEAVSPRNVVRLVLPRPQRDGEDRYAHAARDLASWSADGTLVEGAPALFGYEQEVDGQAWRGVLGAVSVHDSGSGIVLPHEDVYPGPVADRAALMSATGTQLEPIMLVHQGATSIGAQVVAATAGPPEVEVQTDDGVVHRLWRIDDPPTVAALDVAAGTGPALIADGHHRYAAYQELRRRQGAATSRASVGASEQDPEPAAGWSTGLAWLVDASTHPLRLTAIHRTVAGIDVDDVVRSVAPHARTTPTPGPAGRWLADLDAAAAPAWVVTDGDRGSWVSDVDQQWLARVMTGRPASWRQLDAAVLQDALLGAALGMPEGHERLGYAHDARDACRTAQERGGVAVLLRPPRLADVLAAAAAGHRMPRKSTSFGPKPRNGLVLRRVAEVPG
jgi:uncharacterized protein (DUF1015 family)